MPPRPSAAVAAVACGLALAACGQGGGSRGVQVVATTTQVADLVRSVGGPRVEVHQILRPNSDPHDYEPRPSDAERLSRAKLVFQSGGDLDQWLNGLVRSAGGGGRVVRLIDSVRTLRIGGRTDPHWWQDPREAERAVHAIARALIAADPRGRRVYERSARPYLARLRRSSGP